MNESEQLMNQYLALMDTKTNLDEQIAGIKKRLAELNPQGGTILGKKLLLTWPRRTDWKKVEAAFPADQYGETLYSTMFDQAKAKRQFSEAQLMAYQVVPDSPTVTIR